MNVITVVGRLTKDAERKTTKGGTTVLEFTVANDVGFGDNATTNFYRCALFGKRAEGGLADYMVKGGQVAVSGSHRVREYTKKDGSSGYSSEIMVNDVTLCGSKPNQDAPAKPAAKPAAKPTGRQPDPDDRIPF